MRRRKWPRFLQRIIVERVHGVLHIRSLVARGGRGRRRKGVREEEEERAGKKGVWEKERNGTDDVEPRNSGLRFALSKQ